MAPALSLLTHNEPEIILASLALHFFETFRNLPSPVILPLTYSAAKHPDLHLPNISTLCLHLYHQCPSSGPHWLSSGLVQQPHKSLISSPHTQHLGYSNRRGRAPPYTQTHQWFPITKEKSKFLNKTHPTLCTQSSSPAK